MSTPGPEEGSSATQPTAAEGTPDGSDRPEVAASKRRNPWIWVSAVLALAAAGFLIWALALRSDLDGAQQDKQNLQAQIDQGKETGGSLATEAKALYDDVAQQVGSTNEDLAASEQNLEHTKKVAAAAAAAAIAATAVAVKAGNDADQAAKDAEQANAEADKAKAKTEQANADAENAKTETEKAAAEAEKAAAATDQAKAESDAAKAETDRANAEADKADAERDQAKADAQAADSKTAIATECAKAYVSAFGALFEGESAKDQAPAVREQLSAITSDCKAALSAA